MTWDESDPFLWRVKLRELADFIRMNREQESAAEVECMHLGVTERTLNPTYYATQMWEQLCAVRSRGSELRQLWYECLGRLVALS